MRAAVKWLLLLPVAAFPYVAFNIPYGPPGTPSLRLWTPLWVGLAVVCAITVLLVHSRWPAMELILALALVKCCYFWLIPLVSFAIWVVFDDFILFALISLLFFPSGIVGLAAVLQCRREGILTKKAAALYGTLQFVLCADIVSIAILYRKTKEVSL